MKYIVMECHRSYAVLLDENGRFLKAANMNYNVGDTVSDPFLLKNVKKKLSTKQRIHAIIAVAACFLLVFGLGYYQNNIFCYSSITMSINPEIRIDLNRSGEVIDVVATNSDGILLLEGYEFKGKSRIKVADELIERAFEMGYLTEDGTVSFDISSENKQLLEQYGIEISQKVIEYLNGRHTVTVEIKKDHSFSGSSTSTGIPSQNGSGNTNNESGSTDGENSPAYITLDKAKEIALNHAGLSKEDVVFVSAELDEDDGKHLYEIEFLYNGFEYEYEIDAVTQTILKFEKDVPDTEDD